MKKIPTIFVRDMSKQPALVTPEWHPACGWVRDGAGVATLKHDGTCCLVRNGRLYKRRELKPGQQPPADFEQADFDAQTGKTMGWAPVAAGNSEDKFHLEAFGAGGFADGTYELMGPKVQGNKNGLATHQLIRHAVDELSGVPRTFEGLREWLSAQQLEGIVWHHPDGRAAKIKRRDFGFNW